MGKFSTTGQIYYSKQLPEGEGNNVEYDKEIYELLSRVAGNGTERTGATVDSAQVILNQMGYLEDEEVDGHLGPKTLGASRRYLYNHTGTAMWNKIKEHIWDWGDE